MKNKFYDSNEIEQKWYKYWEKNNYFSCSRSGKPFCIVIPPPNVTGTLHMGHGFQSTIMDVLVRYHRMCSDNTLWQLGTDHAGIATQLVVENSLLSQGINKHDIGRDKFIQQAWSWKEHSQSIITSQQRRIGISGDWSRLKFTLDSDLSEVVTRSFVQLYDEGLIYRGSRLVNWDPILKTAISDLEVINQECDGFLWHIKYPIINTNESIIIATTRPETMLADTAVAVHPQDSRYKYLIGKQVALPFSERIIPIIADEYVDPEFGTGCVKITPAHDFNDYEVGKRHNLHIINIFTKDGFINDNAPAKYRKLDRFDARKKIISDLESNGLLIKTEKHKLTIKKGDRSGSIIEPYLTEQWFVRASELAKPAIDAVKNGDIKFIPNGWSNTYFRWLENIQDWCISRQLWWGHRIPAWSDEQNNIYVGANEDDVRNKYSLDDKILKQDEDVLDTWFSSAFWPFSSLGWPKKTYEFNTFYPTSVLVTGFDIIFFWVSRMIMMGLKFTNNVPFKEVYITGLIRDSHGQKMSKSKGNTLDPVDLIDGIDLDSLIKKRTSNLMQQHLLDQIKKQTTREFPKGIEGFGADALRFTFCSLASSSRDINFDIKRLVGYRNFCTKIWNAARFILLKLEQINYETTDEDNSELSLADLWIQDQLQTLLQEMKIDFENYRFDLLAQKLYEFVWDKFCDWYLELAKITIHKRSTMNMMLNTFETLLRALHPFMPFITEELWQEISINKNDGDTIMLQKYPEADLNKKNLDVVHKMNKLQNIISEIRNLKSDMNLNSSKSLTLFINATKEDDFLFINTHEAYLKALTNINLLKISSKKDGSKLTDVHNVFTCFVDDIEICFVIPEYDKTEQLIKIKKEINKINADILSLENKLKNKNYLEKAPKHIVEQDRILLSQYKNKINKMQSYISSF